MKQATGEKPMNDQLNTYLTLRVNKETHAAFAEKAGLFGMKPSTVHREIIEAFLDDRLVIKPNPRKESLYVTRTED
jgi:hypothetical protein